MPRLFLFFFIATATTEIYTLSLHDALPICARGRRARRESVRPAHGRIRLLPFPPRQAHLRLRPPSNNNRVMMTGTNAPKLAHPRPHAAVSAAAGVANWREQRAPARRVSRRA